MDLMDFREDVFNKIKEDYLKFAKELGLSSNITLNSIICFKWR